MSSKKQEQERFLNALVFPLMFTLLLWMIKLIEVLFNVSYSQYGVYPLDFQGLRGIFFSPLIHGNWEHLANNSVPVLVLSVALFYFYRKIAYKVFFLIYFIHTFWLWFFARDSYHIGASGLIYGLGAFIFVSGIIRKNSHLLAISLIVAFEYGSMVWGVFPYEERISWEGHLMGALAGIILAFYFKNYGPQPNINRWKYDLTDEERILEEESEDELDPYWKIPDDMDEDDRKLVE